MGILHGRRKGFVPSVGNSTSNNNTIALIRGKLSRAMPENSSICEEFERLAKRVISRLNTGEKMHMECNELPDENGKPFKFYLIGE
jgi:hypothetical protein